MYEYTGLRRTSRTEKYEAQDELLINGRSITGRVNGYRQITVSGRGLVPYEVESVEYLSRDGAKPLFHRVGVREFTIKYLIQATNSVELRNSYHQLQSLLANGSMTIGFKDDSEYVYEEVYLTGSDVPEEDSNTIVSTFTLTAYDPYRYSRNITTDKVVSIDTEFVNLEGISISFMHSLERPIININNGEYTTNFRLVGSVVSGTEFRLTVNKNTGQVSTVGARVEMASLPKELIAYNGAKGTVVGSIESEVMFRWRDKRL